MGFFDSESIWGETIARFIIQLLLMIIISRLMHLVLDRLLKEPLVISEIITGIILGPSAFGKIPGFTDRVFPASSIPILSTIATAGLLLFMFIVGMELNVSMFSKNIRSAVVISACGIIIPFGAGCGMGVWLWDWEGSETSTANYGDFLVFIGVAVAITSFIALTRIMVERDIFHSRIGVVVVTVAACDDVIAWCCLAFVITLVKSSDYAGAAYTAIVGVAYILFCFFILRYIFRWICRKWRLYKSINSFLLAFIICGMYGSAWLTLEIGIHEIFGAFIFGLIMPRERNFSHNITKKIEDLVVALLVPLYFAKTGLNVDLSTLDSGTAWGITAVLTAVAIASKLFGCGIPTYLLTSLNFRESVMLGFLVSTRGLTELIVLNIGYSLGVIDQRMLTMLVLMALGTTFITCPLLAIIHPPKQIFLWERIDFLKGKEFSILLAISSKSEAKRLVSFARSWILLHIKNRAFALRLKAIDDMPSTYMNWDNTDEQRIELSEKDAIEYQEKGQTDEFEEEDMNNDGEYRPSNEMSIYELWVDRLTFGLWSRIMHDQDETVDKDPVSKCIKEHSQQCGIKNLSLIKKFSPDIKKDICSISANVDMVILGGADLRKRRQPGRKDEDSAEGGLALLQGGVTGYVLKHARQTNVAIYFDQANRLSHLEDESKVAKHVLIPYYGGKYDSIVIRLARKFIKETNNICVTILKLRVTKQKKKKPQLVELPSLKSTLKKWDRSKKGQEENNEGSKDPWSTTTTNRSDDESNSDLSSSQHNLLNRKKKEQHDDGEGEGVVDIEKGKKKRSGEEEMEDLDRSKENEIESEKEEEEEEEGSRQMHQHQKQVDGNKVVERDEGEKERDERMKQLRMYRRDKVLCAALRHAGARVVSAEGTMWEMQAIQKELEAQEYDLLVIGMGKKLRNESTIESLLNASTPLPSMLLVRQQAMRGIPDVDGFSIDEKGKVVYK